MIDLPRWFRPSGFFLCPPGCITLPGFTLLFCTFHREKLTGTGPKVTCRPCGVICHRYRSRPPSPPSNPVYLCVRVLHKGVVPSVISVISVKAENFVGLVIPFGTVLQIIYENTEYSKGSVTISEIVIRRSCNENGHVSVGKGKLCPTKPVYLSLSSSGCTGKP